VFAVVPIDQSSGDPTFGSHCASTCQNKRKAVTSTFRTSLLTFGKASDIGGLLISIHDSPVPYEVVTFEMPVLMGDMGHMICLC